MKRLESWRSEFYANFLATKLTTVNDVFDLFMKEFEEFIKPLKDELGNDDFYQVFPLNNGIGQFQIGDRWFSIELNESNKVKIFIHHRIQLDNGNGKVCNTDRIDFHQNKGVFVDSDNNYITRATIDEIFKKTFHDKTSV